MSDKYDMWADQWIDANPVITLAMIANAMRFCAAKLEEETCTIERFPKKLAPPSFGQTECRHSIETPLIDRYVFCPFCGRRIVEKESK